MATPNFNAANVDQSNGLATKSNSIEKISKNFEETLWEMGNVIAQAQALSAMTWGEPGEMLRNQNDENQDNFMWALDSLIGKIAEMHKKLEDSAPRLWPRRLNPSAPDDAVTQ